MQEHELLLRGESPDWPAWGFAAQFPYQEDHDSRLCQIPHQIRRPLCQLLGLPLPRSRRPRSSGLFEADVADHEFTKERGVGTTGERLAGTPGDREAKQKMHEPNLLDESTGRWSVMWGTRRSLNACGGNPNVYDNQVSKRVFWWLWSNNCYSYGFLSRLWLSNLLDEHL